MIGRLGLGWLLTCRCLGLSKPLGFLQGAWINGEPPSKGVDGLNNRRCARSRLDQVAASGHGGGAIPLESLDDIAADGPAMDFIRPVHQTLRPDMGVPARQGRIG